MTRYAIYVAPDTGSPLWRFGSGVIGYDAATGADLPFTETAGLSADRWSATTEDPRRYGFHATLKAPFELARASSEAALLADVEALAATLSPVTLSGLMVRSVGRFIALVPAQPSAGLQSLAAATVERLDHLRAPLSATDRARRLRSPLTPRQVEYLDRYGYPYVLDEFRFHMTLTGPIPDDAERSGIAEALAAAYLRAVPLGPTKIDAIAVYRQPDRDARFRIIARCPLKVPVATGARP
jgi:putative phosphonate metabolism protein